MITLLKNQTTIKNNIFFQSSIGHIKIFFIDQIFLIPDSIQLSIQNHTLFFQDSPKKNSLKFLPGMSFFLKKNQLILTLAGFQKKKIVLNLYHRLIQTKLKGMLQKYKIQLILKGIGFKAFLENHQLILKLGFSHPISISIPPHITIQNQGNLLIFHSIDYISLTQFVHLIKSFKKPEPYKGKGLLFKNENFLKKEGKKSKK